MKEVQDNYQVLAESESTPQIIEHFRSVAIKWPLGSVESLIILRNFLKHWLSHLESEGEISASLTAKFRGPSNFAVLKKRANDRGSNLSVNKLSAMDSVQPKILMTRKLMHSGASYSSHRRGIVIVDKNSISKKPIPKDVMTSFEEYRTRLPGSQSISSKRVRSVPRNHKSRLSALKATLKTVTEYRDEPLPPADLRKFSNLTPVIQNNSWLKSSNSVQSIRKVYYTSIEKANIAYRRIRHRTPLDINKSLEKLAVESYGDQAKKFKINLGPQCSKGQESQRSSVLIKTRSNYLVSRKLINDAKQKYKKT